MDPAILQVKEERKLETWTGAANAQANQNTASDLWGESLEDEVEEIT